MTSIVNGGYNEDSIQVLDDVEHVRARPGMYIRDTGIYGLHHLVYEVVDNSIDEAMAGVCKNILVTLHAGGSVSIEDDGRGFPVGIKPEFGKTAIELCLTVLGAGGKFNRDSYKVSGGLHGVGVSVVNFLSAWCQVTTRRDGRQYRIAFERGKTTQPLTEIGASATTGTRVEFQPDPQVFPSTDFHYDILAKRLRDLAYLNGGLTIKLHDERTGVEEVFCYEDGIRAFVVHLNEGKEPLHQPIYIYGEDESQRLICEVALQYTDSYVENALAFVNNINTVEGGTHLSGFRSALTRTMNNYARKNNLLKANDPVPQGEDIREGLTTVVSVKVPEPQFEGQTKTKLGNSEVGTFVEAVLGEKLALYLEEHPGEAKRLVQKTVQAAMAREAARKARETARKSVLSGSGFSRKLVDCSSRDTENTEIFIVEGDSAAGSAKGHRDARTQAILPIRGKILNVEKARMHKVLGHEEILEIVRALGTGIGNEECDLSKLRYGRIILMTDADVDGSHIRTLLLTFFFRQMRPLIDAGRMFIAQPPLYQLSRGKKADYVLDDAVLTSRLNELGLDGTEFEIRRPGQPAQRLSRAALVALLRAVSEIQRLAQVLERRGVVLERFVREQRTAGRLPWLRVRSNAIERYFATVEAAEAFELSQNGAALQRQEMPEVRALDAHLDELSHHGCSADDLFARREEQITGEAAPAVFVLIPTSGEPVELDNLLGLPGGVANLGGRGWEVKRFKGLGEMNASELWETTMDPANRVLRKVVVGASGAADLTEVDAVETDRIFSILMGEDVERRKEFIETQATNVKNLDV